MTGEWSHRSYFRVAEDVPDGALGDPIVPDLFSFLCRVGAALLAGPAAVAAEDVAGALGAALPRVHQGAVVAGALHVL